MAVLENGIWYPKKDEKDLPYEDQFALPKAIESGRYHLYMSLACPFAHRPYLVISYLGLDEAISVSSVAAKRFDDGWLFDEAHPDPLYGSQNLAELYQRAKADYTGRVTVPIFWDKHEQTIVGNDSAIIAMELATNWLPLAQNKAVLVPEHLRADIEQFNDWLHSHVNRKVYHVGFATDQKSYDLASETLFNALEELDRRLEQQRYLYGADITLSDLFLLPTLVRFEAVYEVHFKANKKALSAFKNLYRYMLDLLRDECLKKTIDIEYMKVHYYFSHQHINPYRIIPAGPTLSW